MRSTVVGEGGTFKVGWHVAATLGKWKLQDGLLTYQTVTRDPFWITQGITSVELPVGKQVLIWHPTALDGRGGAIPLAGVPDERRQR